MRYQLAKFFPRYSRVLAGAVVATAFGISVSVASDSNESSANLMETADQAGEFKTLLAAVEAAGLSDMLTSGGPYTVFAPSDEAFTRVWPGTVEKWMLPENRAILERLLKHHVVAGTVMAADISDGASLDGLDGSPLTFSTEGGVKIAYASVVATDIAASNGVIHVIDWVLLPEAGRANGS